MKKLMFSISLVACMALTLISCGNETNNSGSQNTTTSNSGFKPGENISLLNEKSYVFTDVVDLNTVYNLPTYKAKNYGDVPYVNVEDLKEFLPTMNSVNVNIKKEGKKVTLTKQDNNNCYVVFDAEANEISYKNIGILPLDSERNSIGYDYCLTSGHVIRSSNKTKVGTVNKDEGKVSLDSYNIKMYDENNKLYVPYDLINVLLQPSSMTPFVFNGKDFFKNPVAYTNPEITTLCYSGNGYFEYGYLENGYKTTNTFKKVEVKNGQKYVYQPIDMNGKVISTTGDIVLYNDGTGKRTTNNTDDAFVDENGRITKIKYKEENKYLTLYLGFTDQSNPSYLPTEDNCDKKIVIYQGDNRFAKGERTVEVANFTYNLLCLSFDYVYSVKEAKNISSFDQYLNSVSLRDKLKSTDAKVYEEAMCELLNTKIDDGHTAMVSLSMFNYPSDAALGIYNANHPLSNTTQIMNKANNYFSERYNSFNFVSQGMRLEDNEDTAYLSFDNFILRSGDVPSNFNSFSVTSDLEELRDIDTCGYMATCILKIEDYNKNNGNKIKNIVLDLTANTGGVMSVLPYVACIMTKDPKLCVADSRTGQVIEYHYEADFDGDGVYGDTYADKYNFFVLTSDASFSCGSSLPSMLKGTKVKIIGINGAGGASPITTFTDGSGLVYKTSGQFGVYYKDNDTYKTIEKGVPVDYEISNNLWYDYQNLTKKIDEIAGTNTK